MLKKGGEKKLFINNKCYKVDGYYYDRENKMRNVYEFLDVIGMDVQNVIVLKKYVKKDRNKKTMKELYDQTKERLKTIEDYLKTKCKNSYNMGIKEEYSKPNPSVNVYIALFTTAHARLKLYELLDILQERVLYMDTDSCIYNDDGSEACKKVENMMGSKLGDLTDEIVSKHNANHIKQFISAGPKDYSMKLDTEKLVSCCKGFRLNAEVEEKITLDKKIKIVTDENEKYETVKYDNIKIGKDHQLKTVKQVKAYDYMFDKRMVCYENENLIRSFPYGY
ncbi:unnamed protein product [Mytilus coruscus]|uniref:Uncharacterized protein n=1 Tax=Mytilus coruscus TaxID=42192 RepID=A0A6J8ERU6_MYTCO|nr:unnamed protein product [Mytilus coruscus]